MVLKCKATCKKVLKKSCSPAFKDLRCGDVIEFSVEIKAVGRNKGTYATYIKCFNLQTKKESSLSFNQIGRTLNCFEFEEINDLINMANEVEDKMEYMCGCRNCINSVTRIIRGDGGAYSSACEECSKYEDCNKNNK